MARRKKRGGSRRKGIRIAATIGIIAGIWETYRVATTTGDPMKQIVKTWTGWDMVGGGWNWKDARAAIAVGAGCGVSMVASKVGLNRYTPKGINI